MQFDLRGDPKSASASELVSVGRRTSERVRVDRSIAIGGRGEVKLCWGDVSAGGPRCKGSSTTAARSVASEGTASSISITTSRSLSSARELVGVHDLVSRLW